MDRFGQQIKLKGVKSGQDEDQRVVAAVLAAVPVLSNSRLCCIVETIRLPLTMSPCASSGVLQIGLFFFKKTVLV